MPDTDAVRSDDAIREILTELSTAWGELPVQAVRRAREHWRTFFPCLLEEMQTAIAVAREGDDPGSIAFWGLALIAERRPGEVDEALPVLVEILSLPEKQSDRLVGDLLTEVMPQALVRVAHQQVELLDGMFGDASLDVYARWAIGGALIEMVAHDLLPRERAVEILRGHLRRVLEQHNAETYSDDLLFPTVIVDELLNLLPHAAVDEMLAAFVVELVDESLIHEQGVRQRVAEGESGFQDAMAHVRSRQLDDCLEFLEPWFNHEESSAWPPLVDDEFDWYETDELAVDDYTPAPTVETFRREQAKVGRNEPCPCGSGRKYKKCCGRS